MLESGKVLVNFNPLSCDGHNLPDFFRFVAVQPQAQKEDVDFMLDEIARLGSDL
jgi:hypothetical protein